MSITHPGIAGVILAGGQSRRMGGAEKSFVLLGGRPLLAHVVVRFRPQVGSLIISANGEAARFDDFGLPVIADRGGAGPLAGLLAAMLWVQGNAGGVDLIAAVPVDTPFLPIDLVARLSTARDKRDAIAIATSGGRDHPIIGLFPTALADDLAGYLAASDDLSARGWIGRHHVVRVDFAARPNGTDPFLNVNSPADLTAAERCREAALHRERKG